MLETKTRNGDVGPRRPRVTGERSFQLNPRTPRETREEALELWFTVPTIVEDTIAEVFSRMKLSRG